ncbi:MAG: arylesterase [Neisseriaceae bacterium]|nr:arylesterase [Neisseriaceae bacterium]
MTAINRRQFLLITTASILTACSNSKKSTQIAKGDTVVALGDSLTAGHGANIAYPTVLQELTGWQVINHGVSGDTSADVLNRLPETLSLNPKLVLFGIGGNDFLRKVAENETKQNIIATIQQMKNKGISVVLIAEPHFTVSALFGRFQDHPMYEEIARQENIPLASDLWSDILSDNSLKSDQIHANDAGYRQFAEKLAQFLKQQGLL